VTKATPTLSPTWAWAGLTVLVCLFLVLAYLIPAGADTLWRLHIARGLLDGQVLYRDMIEVNPPLWFWGAIPAAALGGYPALVGINLGAGLFGAYVFGKLVRLTSHPTLAWAASLALLVGLLLVSVAEIGQREQAFLLACALWSALGTARIETKVVPLSLVVAATALSAYGFALKHYFILVPVAIELLVIVDMRKNWRPFRPETMLLAFLAGLYAVAVIFLTPDFLGRVLGLVQAAYYGFGPWNSVGPVERQARLLMQCAFFFLPILAWMSTRDKTVLVRVLATSLVACVLVIICQQKGWRYHLIAANGLSFIVLAIMWSNTNGTTTSAVTKLVFPTSLAVLALTSIILPAIGNVRTHGQPIEPRLATLIAQEPRAHHIAVLSTAPDNAFYPMARAGRPHWSRHYSMWMMPGLLTPQANSEKDALRLSERARVLNEFTADLTCNPPELIIGERGYFRNPEPKLFDAMDFLREKPAFAAWIDTHYRKQADVGAYPIWRLTGGKPKGSNCTRPH
jgi:hypothetical protein